MISKLTQEFLSKNKSENQFLTDKQKQLDLKFLKKIEEKNWHMKKREITIMKKSFKRHMKNTVI